MAYTPSSHLAHLKKEKTLPQSQTFVVSGIVRNCMKR